jgi:hypothetical protein
MTVTLDGVQLDRVGFSISTMGGRLGMAPMIGENVIRPFMDGRLFVPKRYEERHLVLPMYVVGANADGSIPAGGATFTQMLANLRTLRKAFTMGKTLKTLTWTGLAVGTVTAEVECVDQVDFESMAGATRAVFIPTLRVPGVWFETASYANDGGPTSRTDDATWNATVNGEAEAVGTLRVKFKDVTGGGQDPQITNVTTDQSVVINRTFGVNEEVIIDVGRWRATVGATVVTNLLGWTGGYGEMFRLQRGINNLRFNSTSGDFTVTVEWKERYW